MALQNIKLQKTWLQVKSMWSASNSTTNISLNQVANLTGLNASIPDVSQPPMGTDYSDINLSKFSGLNYNLRGGVGGFNRIMEDDADDGDVSNTIFITYAGSYTARSFMDGTTWIWVNGVSAGSIGSARSTRSLGTLSVGDRVCFDKPCAIYHNTNPGGGRVYGGYAGYCFASRRDRYSKTFMIFNCGQAAMNYDIMYTATGNTNVTSMTSVQSGNISTTGSYATYFTTTTGNYFILTDQLAVVHQGSGLSLDNVQLYPMSVDTKYGWFSTNGHIMATNNNNESRTDTGGGDEIYGQSDTGVDNVVASLGTGRENAYTNTGVGADLMGGSYFSGQCCVVYGVDASGAAGIASTALFACESQADGNGGEMTSFTAIKAHARAAVTGLGSAWNAFVTAGFSGSSATYPAYTDVIMRFNAAGVFQEAQSFTGDNSTNYPLSKAYYGNGSGTGTSATAGDWFWATVSVQGYQDTDSSDKDEENMIMSHDILLPDPTEVYLMASTSGFQGWDNCEGTCENYISGNLFTVHSPTSTEITVGDVVFFLVASGQTYNTPMNGERKYFAYESPDKIVYCLQIDYNGIILDKVAC